MPSVIPPGPYKMVATSDPAWQAPWYIMPFDKDGACTAPLTRAQLVEALRSGDATDVYLFSHGWNNDWPTASARYEDFIAGFLKMRTEYALKLERAYRPLLVGVFWPSTALVLPWESAPRFAGAPAAPDDGVDAWRREIEEIGQAIADADERAEFYRLAQSPRLAGADAQRLAAIVATLARSMSGDDAGVQARDDEVPADEFVRRAQALQSGTSTANNTGQFTFAGAQPGTGAGAGAGGPQAAFALGDLDPRNLVRIATVLQMKDRAARVGAAGVGPLLREILSAHPGARVHAIGHSYGAIVMLSAICGGAELPAPVDSVLLLQAAVSRWCFSDDVDGQGFAGGYRAAFERVRAPILSTFTRRDEPLTKLFHLAARRRSDLGQALIAGGGLPLPQAPSKFAALGGFGPAGLRAGELAVLPIASPPHALALPAGIRLGALNGDESIRGHGDISSPVTWWSLFQQVAA